MKFHFHFPAPRAFLLRPLLLLLRRQRPPVRPGGGGLLRDRQVLWPRDGLLRVRPAGQGVIRVPQVNLRQGQEGKGLQGDTRRAGRLPRTIGARGAVRAGLFFLLLVILYDLFLFLVIVLLMFGEFRSSSVVILPCHLFCPPYFLFPSF